MSRHRYRPTGREMLETDHRRERVIFWKGVLALVLTAALVLLRQRYWV